jgi:hypothetical protein
MAMKNFVLTALLCGSVAQLGGCIIVGDDGGSDPPPPPPPDANEPPPDANEPPPGPGEFLVTWILLGGEVVGGVQGEVTCPPNGVDIRITADPLDTTGPDEVFLYLCTDGTAPADELEPGAYDVWVDLLDADENLIAQSDIQAGLVVDFDEVIPLDIEFSVDAGKFIFTWTITDDGVPTTCDDAGAEEVGLLLTVAGTTFADDYLFPCEADQGVTRPLPIADAYVGDIDLLDNSTVPPRVLGSADAANMTLDYGNHLNDLGNFEFVLP